MCKKFRVTQHDALRDASTAIQEDGVVILEQAVGGGTLDAVRSCMEADTRNLLALRKWGGAGNRRGHIQQCPPKFAPFVSEDIVSNEGVMEVLRRTLGDGFFLSLYSANVNTPGSETQRVHADAGNLWFNSGVTDAKWPVCHPATTLVINIPLVDTDETNGSTEVYIGSNRDTEFEMWVPDERLDKYRRSRANCRKGDVIIRDIRTWHRGMANRSAESRHMLAMIVNVWWLNRAQKNEFHVSAKSAFKIPYFDPNAVYTLRRGEADEIKRYFQVPYLFEGVYAHQLPSQL